MIPDSVNTIRELAFNNCKSLSKLTLPKVSVILGWMSFHGTNLKEVILPWNINCVGAGAFPPNTKILRPDNIK